MALARPGPCASRVPSFTSNYPLKSVNYTAVKSVSWSNRKTQRTTIRPKIKRIAFKKIARYDVAVTMMMIITVPIDSCLVWLLK